MRPTNKYFIACFAGLSTSGCFVSMDDMPSLPPEILGTCHGNPVSYIPTCDDGNDNDSDACINDCKCGLNVSPDLSMDANGNPLFIAFSPTTGPTANQCYLRVRLEKSWDTAKSFCENLDLQLAVLKDPDELLMVKDALLSTTSHSHWIGAQRKDRFHPMMGDALLEWVWLDGTDLSGTDKELWAEGEPNNNPSQNGSEFCAQIFENNMAPNKDGKVNDAPCEEAFYFLCKTPVPLKTKS